ncbi:hypothetical protein R4I06_01080, partial [Anaplasma bovis]
GIYLLAKDLAYNVALDQTDKLTEGMVKLSHKDMYGVKQEMVSLDPVKGGNDDIDTKICKDAFPYSSSKRSGSGLGEHPGTCGLSGNSNYGSSQTGKFSNLWDTTSTGSGLGGNYQKDSITGKVGKETATKISQDIRGLSREQHGAVSSAFAKADASSNTTG